MNKLMKRHTANGLFAKIGKSVLFPALMISAAFLTACIGESAGTSADKAKKTLSVSTPLGTEQSFAILAGSTVTNTGSSVITGNLGVNPGAAVTGFPPGLVAGGTIHAADAVALQAQNDTTTTYNNLASQACDTDLTGQDLGGMTLVSGVYCFSSSAQLTGTLTLDAQGDANAAWVFKTGSTLTTASNSKVKLTNGAQQCNVFWQVGSSATLGSATAFVGNILALTSITLTTGANLSGRALARNGAVSLDTNNVSVSACGVPPVTVTPPVLGKSFNPDTINEGGVSTLTITLSNTDFTAANLTAPLIDVLPSGVLVEGNASTTCGGTLTATQGSSTVDLTGGSIPANGSCTLMVDVTAPAGGSYYNSLPAGALQTSNGNNAAPAVATLTVNAPMNIAPPTLGKSFSPDTIMAGGVATLTITLSNSNSTIADLTAPLIDTLPSGLLTVIGSVTSTCMKPSNERAVQARTTGFFPLWFNETNISMGLTGGSIPANGSCTVTAQITAPVAGSYFNSLPAGALQTSNGNNTAPAVATLTVN